jgi:periplasmic protein TonB
MSTAMIAIGTEEAGQNSVGSGLGVAQSHKDWHTFVFWSIGAVVAILAHGLVGTLMLRWPMEADAVGPTATIVIELSPVVAAPEVQDMQTPPVPEQVQAGNHSDNSKEIEEQTIVEQVESPSQKAPIVVVEDHAEAELPRMAQENDGKQTYATRSEATDNKRHEQTALPKPVKPTPNRPQRQAPNRTVTRPQLAQAREAATSQAPVASTPSNSDALPSWRSQVIGILERNKRYPAEAEARQEHGVSSLAFSLNRQGRVTSAHIAGSSGSSVLDAETLALVHRVQPFPPPPLEVGGAQISLVVAIRYTPGRL